MKNTALKIPMWTYATRTSSSTSSASYSASDLKPTQQVPVVLSETAAAPWEETVLNRLNSLFDLQENWDSYGAKRINQELVYVVLSVLDAVMQPHTPAPYVVPTPNGYIQLEWHRGGHDIEVEIASSANIQGLLGDREHDLSHDVRPLSRALRELTHVA